MLQRMFGLVEKAAAAAQGKGAGAHSVDGEVRQALRLLGRPATLIIDIGGNKGEYSAAALKQSPGVEIHIFEPAGSNVSRLKSRFADRERVHVVQTALSSEAGEATLFSDKDGSGLASLINRDVSHFGISLDRTESVRTMRFEDYWSGTLQSRPISIAKMDVEGHELEVLLGFGKALGACSVIQFEFGGCNIDSRSYLRDFWKFFDEAGFTLYRVTPFGAVHVDQYRERDEHFTTSNFLALNRRLPG